MNSPETESQKEAEKDEPTKKKCKKQVSSEEKIEENTVFEQKSSSSTKKRHKDVSEARECCSSSAETKEQKKREYNETIEKKNKTQVRSEEKIEKNTISEQKRYLTLQRRHNEVSETRCGLLSSTEVVQEAKKVPESQKTTNRGKNKRKNQKLRNRGKKGRKGRKKKKKDCRKYKKGALPQKLPSESEPPENSKKRKIDLNTHMTGEPPAKKREEKTPVGTPGKILKRKGENPKNAKKQEKRQKCTLPTTTQESKSHNHSPQVLSRDRETLFSFQSGQSQEGLPRRERIPAEKKMYPKEVSRYGKGSGTVSTKPTGKKKQVQNNYEDNPKKNYPEKDSKA